MTFPPERDATPGDAAPGLSQAAGERFKVRGRISGYDADTVALALDTADGSLVILKRRSEPEAVRHEAGILEKLDHPSIIKLRHSEIDNDRSFLVLEFVNAPTLDLLPERMGRRLTETEVIELMRAVAGVVTAVHEQGYLHRDLKPANILIRQDGSPVLVDFGAALPIDGTTTPHTQSDLTPGYAAPEQYLSDLPEGPWTDVYALGAIAYKLLTGDVPAPGLARLRGETEPSDLAAMGEGAAFRRAIIWALEPQPADRPQRVEAWTAAWTEATPTAIAEALHDPDEGLPTERVERTQMPAPVRRPEAKPAKPVRRAAAALVAVLLLGVFGAGSGLAAIRAYPLYQRYLQSSWVVDPDGEGDTRTIGEALARAGAGATIAIRSGTYRESLLIDHPVELIGLDASEPPLIAPDAGPCALFTQGGIARNLAFRAPTLANPSHAPTPCLVLTSDAQILGNRIEGASGPAILVRKGVTVQIRDNVIGSRAGAGIELSEGASGLIAGNEISGIQEMAIVVRSGAEPSVVDNTIEDSGAVVYAEGARGRFANNRLANGRRSAFEVLSGADPLVVDNTFTEPEQAGIFAYDAGRGLFRDNEITGSGLSGVVIMRGAAPDLIGNTIRGNGEHGVIALDGSAGALFGNTIAANEGFGIAIAPEARITRSRNRIATNQKSPQVFDARVRVGAGAGS